MPGDEVRNGSLRNLHDKIDNVLSKVADVRVAAEKTNGDIKNLQSSVDNVVIEQRKEVEICSEDRKSLKKKLIPLSWKWKKSKAVL